MRDNCSLESLYSWEEVLPCPHFQKGQCIPQAQPRRRNNILGKLRVHTMVLPSSQNHNHIRLCQGLMSTFQGYPAEATLKESSQADKCKQRVATAWLQKGACTCGLIGTITVKSQLKFGFPKLRLSYPEGRFFVQFLIVLISGLPSRRIQRK